jgi:hypothetical protein
MGAKADSLISKIEEWVRKQLLYNTLIRFFIESYIEIVTSSMIQFYQSLMITFDFFGIPTLLFYQLLPML